MTAPHEEAYQVPSILHNTVYTKHHPLPNTIANVELINPGLRYDLRTLLVCHPDFGIASSFDGVLSSDGRIIDVQQAITRLGDAQTTRENLRLRRARGEF